MITNPGGKLNSNFTYDNNGNLLNETKMNRPDQSKLYSYDDEMRLTEFQSGTITGNSIPSPLHEDAFNYDALGNRTSAIIDSLSTTYAGNSMNEYTTITGASAITMQYDNNGNLINDGNFTYSYDVQNRLTSVNNGAISNYKYDALGRRIQKTVAGTSTNYFYAGANEIEDRDSSGNVLASYVFGDGADDIIATKINNNDYYFYRNAIGSVTAVGNSSGSLVERYEYDPFGKVSLYDGNYNLLVSSQIGNTRFFTGRTFDNEIGKYYNRAREYDGSTGRFEQRDPYRFITGDMNLYSYAMNKPTHYIDPFGTECNEPSAGFTSGFGANSGTDIANAASFEAGSGLDYAGLTLEESAKAAAAAEKAAVESGKPMTWIMENGKYTGFFNAEGKFISASRVGLNAVKVLGPVASVVGFGLSVKSSMDASETYKNSSTAGNAVDLGINLASTAVAGIGTAVVVATALGYGASVAALGATVMIGTVAAPVIAIAAAAFAIYGLIDFGFKAYTGMSIAQNIDNAIQNRFYGGGSGGPCQ